MTFSLYTEILVSAAVISTAFTILIRPAYGLPDLKRTKTDWAAVSAEFVACTAVILLIISTIWSMYGEKHL